MQVEVFESVELDENGVGEFESPEAVEKFRETCARLGLKGQARLVSQPKDVKPAVATFRPMTHEERFAYGVLLSTRSSVEVFDESPIPTRVLEVFEKAKGVGTFADFEVWSAGEVAVRDPLLVGMVSDSGYASLKIAYPLARWGDVLEPLSTLVKRAGEVFRASRIADLKRIASRVAADIATLADARPEEVVSVVSFENKWNRDVQNALYASGFGR
jgi:hypothetical protein